MAKRKYSINWDDDVPISFEVDGVQYQSLEEISNETDRLKLEGMMNSSLDAELDAEFAQMNQEVQQVNGPAVEKIILWVFTGIAVLMLLIAGIASLRNILKVNREEDVPGRVVEMTKRLQYDEENSDRVIGEAYFPVVEFVAKDGRRHHVQLSEGSWPPAYEVGDEVVVLYEPEHPLDARIKSAGSSALMWVLPGITGVLGVAFLVAVLVVQKFMLPQA